ncbi:hypothetical protein [Streptomyces wedmorensis]
MAGLRAVPEETRQAARGRLGTVLTTADLPGLNERVDSRRLPEDGARDYLVGKGLLPR